MDFDRYVLLDSPSSDDVSDALAQLRGILKSEMRRRGAFNLAPSKWGYTGKFWRQNEAINDLLKDCFADIFSGKRLARLREYVNCQSTTISPVIRWQVRNILNDKEKRSDPVGYALFKNLQVAVDEAIASNELRIVDKTKPITNQTIFRAFPFPQQLTLAPRKVIVGVIAGWGDSKSLGLDMASLRSNRGLAAAREVVKRIRTEIAEPFRFGELVDSFRQLLPRTEQDSKVDHISKESLQGKSASKQTEETDNLDTKSVQMENDILNLTCHAKVKSRLMDVWRVMVDVFRKNGSWPNKTEIAEIMNIAKQRVAEDFERLGPLILKNFDQKPDN